MSKGKKVLLVILVILLIGAGFGGGFALAKNLNEKNQVKCKDTPAEEPKEEVKEPETKEKEASAPTVDTKKLKAEIQDVYSKAYDEMYNQFEGSSNTVEVTYNGEKINASLISSSELGKYFTKKELEFVLNYYSTFEQNGKYYYAILDTGDDDSCDYEAYFDPGTIFGATDYGTADLVIRTYSDNYVLAQSNDDEGYYIVFKKENGSWKIDMFE